MVDRGAVHDRRRAADRDRKRAERAALDAAGEVYGSRLDVVILDAVSLMLRGRREGDPMHDAYMAALAQSLRCHRAPLSRGLYGRLRARHAVSTNLRWRLAEAEISDTVQHIDG